MKNDFEIDPNQIDRLAELAVYTGVGLKPEQNLLITAPIESLPLVRRISVHAYKAGAGLVTPIFSDPEITLARYRHAHNNSFDKAANCSIMQWERPSMIILRALLLPGMIQCYWLMKMRTRWSSQ